LNALLLKYAKKTYAFRSVLIVGPVNLTLYIDCSWLGMLMLSIVAALDWNYHINRPGKLGKDGKQLYKSKVNYPASLMAGPRGPHH
jgi:hypothetical protein